eukprot:4707989-Prymnesium_polylepis.1
MSARRQSRSSRRACGCAGMARTDAAMGAMPRRARRGTAARRVCCVEARERAAAALHGHRRAGR